ncbi:hypothetical protein Nepgr_002193 [Nepenthes gracilis]|uniref:Uncharacterized protein n=1 Tax=Nepenthes gracilis TaxID=150966 RepID=A0AAD3P9D1_NEPGR|nr:hypothetical protein Nepgr_002193 [Nepenthes gracilis]
MESKGPSRISSQAEVQRIKGPGSSRHDRGSVIHGIKFGRLVQLGAWLIAEFRSSEGASASDAGHCERLVLKKVYSFSKSCHPISCQPNGDKASETAIREGDFSVADQEAYCLAPDVDPINAP